MYPPTPIQLRTRVEVLRALLKTVEEEIAVQGLSGNVEDADQRTNKVFIVHGHDGAMKEAAARLVTALGLEAVILHEEPNKGRTIIEKFSDHAQEAGFAIVLLSTDDEGKIAGIL